MVSPKYAESFKQLKGYLKEFEEKEKEKTDNFFKIL